MFQMSRRNLLTATLAAPLATQLTGFAAAQSAGGKSYPAGPDDERFWAAIAANYDVTDDITNVENGNWGLMARPVLDAYKTHTERVNRENSYFARRAYWPIYMGVLEETASRLGVSPKEIAFTRGATEALQNIISGYNKLKQGDAVMIADLVVVLQVRLDGVLRESPLAALLPLQDTGGMVEVGSKPAK